jgi:hypothetical protein
MEEMACTYGYPIDERVVSRLLDMSNLVDEMEVFNKNIWSSVTKVKAMFGGASVLRQDIGSLEWIQSWIMFCCVSDFNQQLGSWDVSNVGELQAKFCLATSFNQDIGSWNISNSRDMQVMFCQATPFNQDIGLCPF